MFYIIYLLPRVSECHDHSCPNHEISISFPINKIYFMFLTPISSAKTNWDGNNYMDDLNQADYTDADTVSLAR